jgi:hypothetical protein
MMTFVANRILINISSITGTNSNMKFVHGHILTVNDNIVFAYIGIMVSAFIIQRGPEKCTQSLIVNIFGTK